jgi:Leucine-rich repeat (LRR) protein
MKFRKLILTYVLLLLIFVCCRSPRDAEQLIPNKTSKNWGRIHNTSKNYSTSTKDLKSNLIPDTVFLIENLENLSITGMDCDYGDHTTCWMIAEIPTAIKNLKALKSLSLTVNAIRSIPIELTELKQLTIIDLTDNPRLSNIENIEKIERLEFLYLYGCGLTKLPNEIGRLKNLKQIGLVGNNLSKDEIERIKKALPNCIIIFK